MTYILVEEAANYVPFRGTLLEYMWNNHPIMLVLILATCMAIMVTTSVVVYQDKLKER